METTVARAHPGGVVTTWNLVNSAAVFEGEQQSSVPWVSIEDLCALIEMFCLYDSAHLFGRHTDSVVAQRDLHLALEEASFLRVADTAGDVMSGRLGRASSQHLAVFLGEDFSALMDAVRRRSADSTWDRDLTEHLHETSYADEWAARKWADTLTRGAMEHSSLALGGSPDPAPDRTWTEARQRQLIASQLLHEGREWSRQDTFVLRTFLYLAYADVSSLAFVPDGARRPIMSIVGAGEASFRVELRAALLDRLRDAVVDSTPGGDVFRSAPPLAAIVLDRSRRDRRRIVPEMQRLRSELSPLRARLAEFEQAMFDGSRDEAIKAQAQWERALQEVATNFGPTPALVTLERGLNFAGEEAVAIVSEPTNPSTWLKTLLGLPMDVLKRLMARRTLVGIHDLRADLPAAGRLHDTIVGLFSPE